MATDKQVFGVVKILRADDLEVPDTGKQRLLLLTIEDCLRELDEALGSDAGWLDADTLRITVTRETRFNIRCRVVRVRAVT
jgi:hypothetical protein